MAAAGECEVTRIAEWAEYLALAEYRSAHVGLCERRGWLGTEHEHDSSLSQHS